jgi:DNA-directed RNA polymerase subunit RPC12/RpoP
METLFQDFKKRIGNIAYELIAMRVILKKRFKGLHYWNVVPFSGHHGMEPYEYRCVFCNKTIKEWSAPSNEKCPWFASKETPTIEHLSEIIKTIKADHDFKKKYEYKDG